MNALSNEQRAKAQEAVFATVLDKVTHFLGSAGRADEAAWAQVTA